MTNCKQCNCKIYTKEKIEGYSPGSIYKGKLYCVKCLEGIYFLEDMIFEDEDKQDETIQVSKTTPKQCSLVCPYCKTSMKYNEKICPNCEKPYPLFSRKPKKKSRRKKNKK